MQQPQTRPLLGDSVSSATSPNARRNNPVAVLTHQQLQQLQQLQAQNSTGQPLTFALQQSASNNAQDQGPSVGQTGTAIGNNQIVYLNQLSQLNQNPPGTGMGLPPAAPTFGVGLNMGLPLSLLNTSLTSLTSNVITTSNPLLNLGIPSINSALTTVNPGTLNTINALNALNSNSITANGLVGQDLNSINRLNQSAHQSLNQGQFSTINTTDNISSISHITNINNINNQSTGNQSVNQAFNRTSLNVLATGLTPNSAANFPFQTIQSIQSIAPHIVSGSSATSTSVFTSSSAPILSTSQPATTSFAGTMSMSSSPAVVSLSSLPSDSINSFSSQRQFQGQPPVAQSPNTVVKCIQNVNSPGSPFSIPMKSPASNIAPPTPSPSPNRILLRSPASNSMQSNRNSPSPVSMVNTSSTGTTTTQNFTVQLQSPMQSPMSNIQSPAASPYPPAKSPHHTGNPMTGNTTGNLNNRSPASGGSPGPTPVMRPNTPILQQGMQVLQIIGTPQGYQQASSQLVTRAALFGNQQIQIAQAKPAKQPPQILPKPPNSQGVATPPKQRVTTTTITNHNQVSQQTQPQLVLAGPQQSQATMIPTAQGLLLNQVLPSTGPVIVQQQPGGVQLILRTPANAQQQTHTAQLTQQQLVRVVTAQGMQLQGLTPTFFAVPNGFTPPAPPVLRHTTANPTSGNSSNNNQIVIQNTMVQNPQSHQVSSTPTPAPVPPQSQPSPQHHHQHQQPPPPFGPDQNLLPPPKKKAKKKKKTKKKDEEPPKLDLASIMKISGIGDEDDMFDTEPMPEPEPQPQIPQEQPQIVQMTGQHMEQLSSPPQGVHNQQHGAVQSQITPNQASSEGSGNQMVAQLQMPVHNAISGQLRLAVGEDGRVILHHTPDPNQPEIDQATAQALIRSLTQGSGQNSQIISQLLGHAQNLQQNAQQNLQQNVQHVQNTQNVQQNIHNVQSPTSTGRGKGNSLKATTCVTNQAMNQVNQVNQVNQMNSLSTATSQSQGMLNLPQNQQMNQKSGTFQQQQNNSQNIVVQQRNVSSVPPSPTSATPPMSLNMTTKTMQTIPGTGGIQIAIGSPTDVPKHQVHKQNDQMKAQVAQQTTTTTTVINQQNQQKSTHPCKKVIGQVFMGNLQQQQQQQQVSTVQSQTFVKTMQTNTNKSRTVQQQQQIIKNRQATNVQHMINLQNRIDQQQQQQQQLQQQLQQQQQQQLQQQLQQQQQQQQQQQADQFSQQNIHQVSTQTVQSVNIQRCLDQNLHKVTVSGLQQQNSLNILETTTNPQLSEQTSDQNKILLQNSAQNIIHRFADGQPQQAHTDHNESVQHQDNSNINIQQQKLNIQNKPQNLIFSSDFPTTINTSPAPTKQQPQVQTHNQQPQVQQQDTLNPAATNILNNAPKITPEILNALSNLNPNDQLLIANANGQMQVISQQLLQQLLTGQLNTTSNQRPQTVNQNQTQKIVIGEADASNTQNLQGVQINTPNSQIIVNSSGGAPTIQNNIQNIVVQASPSQMPHQIQIQNPAFPSQFIDDLNQQQIRNLNSKTTVQTTASQPQTSQTTSSPSPLKKAKVVKRTKVSSPQATTFNPAKVAKMASVATSTLTAPMPNKEVLNAAVATKNEPARVATSSSGNQTIGIQTQTSATNQVPSNGQMIQRTPRYIQLPVQKQQMLKSIQTQIQSILARKTNTAAEQSLLTKLYQEHNKIVASGKVVSAPSLTIPSSTETTTTSASIPSATVYTISHSQSSVAAVKTQQSSTQTQTMVPVVQDPTKMEVSTADPSMPTLNNKSSLELPKFHAPKSVPTVPVQQSAQCQTDLPDIKPNIQQIVKQELPSPVPVSNSPSGQVVNSSPRSLKSQPKSPVSQIKQPLASPSTSASPSASQSPRHGVKRPATSPIARQINRCDLVEQQLKIDQNGAVNPDVNSPFLSKRDACKRLVRYHCFNEQVLSEKDLAKADEIFEETAKHLLSKFSSMMNKYTYLLLMESMREVRTSELMMLDRAFVAEEQSMLNRLRDQEAKANEELKKEEKPLLPKLESDLPADDEKSSNLTNVLVKQELEDDFCEMNSQTSETQMRLKPSSCTSGDYDEWLEIQKELGAYSAEAGKSKNPNSSGFSSNGACGSGVQKTRCERTRANGVVVNQSTMKNVSDSENNEQQRRSNATDLERDLLEDADSLDDLALQSQCPSTSADDQSSKPINEHDDITAQVQSAIDSILNLKKRPNTAVATSTTSSSSQQQTASDNSKDSVLDQAVRSIMGS